MRESSSDLSSASGSGNRSARRAKYLFANTLPVNHCGSIFCADYQPSKARKPLAINILRRATKKIFRGAWVGVVVSLKSNLESILQSCRGVAQPGSAPALGAGGRRFKSYRPDQFSICSES